MDSKRSAARSRNPFAVDPLPKAYYFPSPEKYLNKAEKSTAIKTNYSTEVRQEQTGENAKMSPVDERFLRGTNMYRSKPSGPNDIEEDVNFDETWQSSERPSSVSFTGLEDDSPFHLNRYLSHPARLTGLKQNFEFEGEQGYTFERRRMPGSTSQGTGVNASGDTGKLSRSKIPMKNVGPGGKKWEHQDSKPTYDTEADGSVLQRYINRFRNSQPTSREERDQKIKSASKDFWWLSNGQPPTAKENSQDGSTSHTTPLTTVNLDKYKYLQQLADKQRTPAYIPESPGDKRTIELQERAEKLLERSSSTVLSTEPAVSTEGLGSNTSDLSSLEEYSYRPKFANYLDSDQRVGYQQLSQPPLLGQEPKGHRVGYQSLVPPPLPGQRPPAEDDPLHQWRLKRRMELVQQSAPQHTQQFDFINKTEQQKKVDQKLEEFKQKLSGRAPARSQMQFTPAPQQRQQQTTNMQPCQNVQQMEGGRFHEPQIASPSLHPPKPKSKPDEEIDPHLHLMCDLLPCPHRGHFQGTTEIEPSSESRNNFTDNLEERVNSSSGTDKNSDKMGNYKQYLEAEKPDVEKIIQDEDACEVDRGKGKKMDKRSILEIEEMVKDIGDKDVNEQLISDRDEENASKISDRKMQRSDNTEDSSSEKSDRMVQRSSNKRTDKKMQKDPKEKGCNQSGSESERSQTKPKHLEREVYDGDSLKESEGKRDGVIKPKHSSSPKNGRKGVSAAIGQVIKEHLFSTSTSTVLSSVDSLPPSASTDKLPWKQKPPSHSQHVIQLEHNDTPYESDEDFTDDDLLQMLRKQRAMYEQQLQEIDNMLNKMDSR